MDDDDELEAMKKIKAALEPLEDAARQRALHWAFSRYRGGTSAVVMPARLTEPSLEVHPNNSQFADFAELFDAANPSTEKDKALVAAYWIQVCQSVASFPSQTINAELKDLGHGVGNITEALTQLKNERPALILQLKKSGTSRQARKTYKLTIEGVKRVQTMIQNKTLQTDPT